MTSSSSQGPWVEYVLDTPTTLNVREALIYAIFDVTESVNPLFSDLFLLLFSFCLKELYVRLWPKLLLQSKKLQHAFAILDSRLPDSLKGLYTAL